MKTCRRTPAGRLDVCLNEADWNQGGQVICSRREATCAFSSALLIERICSSYWRDSWIICTSVCEGSTLLDSSTPDFSVTAGSACAVEPSARCIRPSLPSASWSTAGLTSLIRPTAAMVSGDWPIGTPDQVPSADRKNVVKGKNV